MITSGDSKANGILPETLDILQRHYCPEECELIPDAWLTYLSFLWW